MDIEEVGEVDLVEVSGEVDMEEEIVNEVFLLKDHGVQLQI
jgi:hypothetical protein